MERLDFSTHGCLPSAGYSPAPLIERYDQAADEVLDGTTLACTDHSDAYIDCQPERQAASAPEVTRNNLSLRSSIRMRKSQRLSGF